MSNFKENPRDVKHIVLAFRVTEFEAEQIKGRANLYASGNQSDWIRHCCLNYKNPKFLKKNKGSQKQAPPESD